MYVFAYGSAVWKHCVGALYPGPHRSQTSFIAVGMSSTPDATAAMYSPIEWPTTYVGTQNSACSAVTTYNRAGISDAAT